MTDILTQAAYFSDADLSLEAFKAICSQRLELAHYPHAVGAEKNILLYDGPQLQARLGSAQEQSVQAELCRALRDGPGVLVIRDAYPNLSVIDQATEHFRLIVAEERAAGGGQGDHFGSNERIWNSLQKLCLRAPELFIDYYGNSLLALTCRAWLGPAYQITAQMNTVKPGGKAQAVHRDYHLGFQSPEVVAQFPAHAQTMSQYLTLQGAIVHGDMPLAAGPTVLLPFSQTFLPGYLAYTRPDFAAYAAEQAVQLPLQKGDLVFFSPALFHGAGTNQSNQDRIANLVQVSSAFGRAMEALDRTQMIRAVYPELLKRGASLTDVERRSAVAALAEGYAFPTNLDADPPLGGNAPRTQQALVLEALAENWSPETLVEALDARAARRRP